MREATRETTETNGTIRRRNPRQQGVIGVARAIAWFTSQGYDVWVPLGEPTYHDLVVEDSEGKLMKVEVKTTTCRNERGRFVVHIATNGGNQSWTGLVKTFDPHAVDLLYVLTDDGAEYVIPADSIRARTKLTLSHDLAPFRVARSGKDEEQMRLS